MSDTNRTAFRLVGYIAIAIGLAAIHPGLLIIAGGTLILIVAGPP